MLTYIGFAECGVMVGNSCILGGTSILPGLRLDLIKQYKMMRRKTAPPAMPPMAEVLRPLWELELDGDVLSAPVDSSVGHGVMVQLVLVEVGMEGV